MHEAKKMFYFRFPPSHLNVNKEIKGEKMIGKERKKLKHGLTESASFLFLFSILPPVQETSVAVI